MGYLGNKPADSYLTLEKQTFTTSATDTYTLDRAVSSVNDIELFLNNVRQEPTEAYTISGTTLTLASPITASDSMYCIYQGRAVGTQSPAVGSVTGAMMSYPLTNFSSTGIDDNASANALTIDSSSNLQFNSGYGSVATAYGCRAWVNYDGRVSVGIRNSGNVSSVTDNGTGDYTINFTNAMPDTNYCIASANATYLLGNTDYRWFSFVDSVSTTSFSVQTNVVQNGISVTDSAYVNHVVFR